MFAGLINHAKAAASGLVLKYVARASVAIPFVIALGFALAAITVMLVERFGHVTGYWLVAGGLAAIGIVAAITVSVKEHEEEVAEQQAEQSDTEEVISDATAQAMINVQQVPSRHMTRGCSHHRRMSLHEFARPDVLSHTANNE